MTVSMVRLAPDVPASYEAYRLAVDETVSLVRERTARERDGPP